MTVKGLKAGKKKVKGLRVRVGRVRLGRSVGSGRAGRSIGTEIVSGLKEAVAFERGGETGAVFRQAPITVRDAEVLPAPSYNAEDVLRIRMQLDVSQDIFARLLDVSRATVRSWEQKQKPPSGAARRLLQLAEKHPEVLLEQIRRIVHRGARAT
jgi:putative transcriptional regulator